MNWILEHAAKRIVTQPGVSIVAGSAPDCDIRLPADLPADFAPPRYARFFQENDELWVEHLGSAPEFGIFVNGEPVERARVREGDRILLGILLVKVRLADPSK